MCLEDIRRSKEKYRKEVENHMKDFFERGLYREEYPQQEPQELKQEIQQEKPQQEPQELRKEADLAAGGAAQADLAKGGAAQATFQKGAWTPANPREAGFAGQGQSTQ